jgi:acetyl-CoA acyltransferase
MKPVKDVVIVAYGRSPIGKAIRGSLASEYPTKIAAEVLKGVLAKVPEVTPEILDDVIVGCAMPEDVQGLNVARAIAQRAELPDRVPALTVNRFCSSGLQSIALGANAIMADQADIIVAGGVESMSMIPASSADISAFDPWLFKNNAAIYTPMGSTAELVAQYFDVSREEMDEFAVASHKKAAAARNNGEFKKEIVPVTYTDKEGNKQTLTEDEGIREDTTVEALAELRAAFKENGGIVTAGNSSQVSDGAAFVVMMSTEKAAELGVRPIARFVGYAVEGVSPYVMGIGPISAIPKLLQRIGMETDRFDVIELNEAFAAQAIPCIRDLQLDTNKVNPRGGALALGHPLGATGAILMCKAISYLEDTGGRYGLISMCIGGGMGAAGAIEMV